MKKSEFLKLGKHPKIKVRWGGQEYIMVNKNEVRGTCFLQPVGKRKLRPYPVEYKNVEIIK